MFGTLRLVASQGKNTRSPDGCSMFPLDGERLFVAILHRSEQAFPEHPFTDQVCHTH